MGTDEGIKKMIQESDLEEKYQIALEKDSGIEKQLQRIKSSYSTNKACYSKKCESTAQQLLMLILSDEELKDIHSARYRIKSTDSLLLKYVKKKALLPKDPGMDYNIEKYRPMNSVNYYKIITDLIGIRILIRYQQQWETVHKWIWDNFYKSERTYITNWLKDYPQDSVEDFIVEKPKLYLRDEKELSLYESAGKDIFEVRISEAGYNSLHYLLWYDGKYAEIQVRTIYDEAWGECTHDLVYKCKLKSRRVELERLSNCLASQTQAAGLIAGLMYEKAEGSPQRPSEESVDEISVTVSQNNRTYAKLEKRMQKMKNAETGVETFDGQVDSLL